ncbi:MAG: AraC family transcriptional regulator, partial [Bdellovibrio sp.]
MKAFLFAVLSFLLLMMVYLWTYLGAWKTREISLQEKPRAWVLGKTHVGAYHGVSKIIESVESEMFRQSLSCPKSFGEFLDDPNLVEEIRLRSRAGCWYETLPSGLRERPLPKDWFLEESSPRKAILARFLGAPSIGPIKVYP